MRTTQSFIFKWVALVGVLAAVQLSAEVYTVSVPDYQANPGTVLNVPLTLDNATGLAQIRLQLNYDSQVLSLLNVSPGPLGAQFDFSHETVNGVVTMDFVRATTMGEGGGRLAMAEFQVNPGATIELYSDLAIARFEVGDDTGVRDIASGQSLRTENGSVRVSVLSDIDNESNGLPDWWELQHNLDLFSPPLMVDSDADSVSDYLEYVHGGDPMVPDASVVAPVASVQEIEGHRYLVMTFRRQKGAVNQNYVLLESETLSDWESIDINSRLVGPPLDLGDRVESVSVRWKEPLNGPDAALQGFMRIRVEPRL